MAKVRDLHMYLKWEKGGGGETSFFRKDKWVFKETIGDKKVCVNICLCKFKQSFSIFFTAIKLQRRNL